METIVAINDLALMYLNKELVKLNKKAVKVDVQPISVEVLNTWFTKDAEGNLYQEHEVRVTGEAPKLPGWNFGCTVEHRDGENVLRKSPHFTLNIPERYRHTDHLLCEHCEQRRTRNDTYVVYNEDTQEWKQVGSGCLKDFMGHGNPTALAEWLEAVNDWLETIKQPREHFSGDYHGPSWYSTEEFLSIACGSVRMYGWVSRAKSDQTNDHATADHIRDYLSAVRISRDYRSEYEKRVVENCTPTTEDIERAQTIIEWFKNATIDPDDEYKRNLKAILVSEACEWRDIGLIASATIAYWFAVEKPLLEAAQKAEEPESHHVGQIKERLDFKAKVDWIHEYHVDDTYYGDNGHRMIIKFRDESGNLFTWFTSPQNVEVGETVNIRGTVKKHDEYKGRKHTVITRCKLTFKEDAK